MQVILVTSYSSICPFQNEVYTSSLVSPYTSLKEHASLSLSQQLPRSRNLGILVVIRESK